jgi:hypothetical protein
LYHEKLYGAIPPGLIAFIVPVWEPEALQKMKIGSFTNGSVEYDVYLTAFAPGPESWAREKPGNSIAMIRKK